MASDKPEVSLWFLDPYFSVGIGRRECRTYILNNGSQTVTARLDTCPFARVGGSRKSCLSAEHSRTRPYRESSSRKRSYALTTVDTGVKLTQIRITSHLEVYCLPVLGDCIYHFLWYDVGLHNALYCSQPIVRLPEHILTWAYSVDRDVLFLRAIRITATQSGT